MAGIYIHIPYCKQACHYCDFHFSTSSANVTELIAALRSEIVLRKEYLGSAKIETIYFGGGTPSILKIDDLLRIFDTIYSNFDVDPNAEITVEANPDDLTLSYLKQLRHTSVNRLSIGIQSFRNEDLKMMNRAHDAKQALRCVPESADLGFERLSVDLIYGIPGLGLEGWKQNLKTALDLPVNHLSSYCLTVEANTVLHYQVAKGTAPNVNDEEAAAQFEWLHEYSEEMGFPWYEISNLSKPGCESKHNSNYWNGIPYLGIGPSAHSFDGTTRQWNIRNNPQYIISINQKKIPSTIETLSSNEQFNEFIMTGLRLRRGISSEKIIRKFGDDSWNHIVSGMQKYIDKDMATINRDKSITLTTKGLLFTDSIVSSLLKI